MPPAKVEPALGADVEALAAIFVRCWRHAYRGIVADSIIDRLDEREARDMWRTLVAGHRVLVARVGDAPLGMIRLGPDEADSSRGHVFSLYVDPAAARAGLGRALLAQATAELAAAGYRTATLWVFAKNERALRFYRAASWSPTGETRVEPQWGALELQLATQLG